MAFTSILVASIGFGYMKRNGDATTEAIFVPGSKSGSRINPELF